MSLISDADYFIHQMRLATLHPDCDSFTKRIVTLQHTEKEFLQIQKQLSFNHAVEQLSLVSSPTHKHSEPFKRLLGNQSNNNMGSAEIPVPDNSAINQFVNRKARKDNAAEFDVAREDRLEFNHLKKLKSAEALKVNTNDTNNNGGIIAPEAPPRDFSSKLKKKGPTSAPSSYMPSNNLGKDDEYENHNHESDNALEDDDEEHDDDDDDGDSDSITNSIKVDLTEAKLAISLHESKKAASVRAAAVLGSQDTHPPSKPIDPSLTASELEFEKTASTKSLENMFQKIPIKPANLEKRMSHNSLLRQVGDNLVVTPTSALTALLNDKGSDNPFAADFSIFCGKGDLDPIVLRIYIPYSEDPSQALQISVKREAKVEDVIGYALYEYVNQQRQPMLDASLCDVICWTLRIVEDDGTIDDDFPALERSRKIQKFSFDQFALCVATPQQMKSNENLRKAAATAALAQPATIPSNVPASAAKPTTYLLRVHLYSTLEVKQTTTLSVPSTMLIKDVFDQICQKRKYNPKDYLLKMADTKTDVPMDKTLEQLKIMEFCVLKRDRGGAGDIFLRPPEEPVNDTELPRFISTDEYTSMYKQYNVIYKHFMGKHERMLTIDGDYIHLVPVDNKKILDLNAKTSSYHIGSVVSCKQNKKNSLYFKLVVFKNNDSKSYDLEASTPQEAGEICTRITFMMQLKTV